MATARRGSGRTTKSAQQAAARREQERVAKPALGMIETESILPEDHPKIVRSTAFAAKPMSVEEASLQLEIVPENFLVFMNQNTQAVNVIHKRKDGSHGLIEPGI